MSHRKQRGAQLHLITHLGVDVWVVGATRRAAAKSHRKNTFGVRAHTERCSVSQNKSDNKITSHKLHRLRQLPGPAKFGCHCVSEPHPSPCFIVPLHYVSSLLSCRQQLHVVSYTLFLIKNMIPNFGPLVASPSVTSVRQEKSNYCILASRRACLHERLSCSVAHSADVLFSGKCRTSEI